MNKMILCFTIMTLLISAGLTQSESVTPNMDNPSMARLRIINALDVESIELLIDDKIVYPDFRRNEKTSGGSTTHLDSEYLIRDRTTGFKYSQRVKLLPDSIQSMLMMGNLSPVPPGGAGIFGINDGNEEKTNIVFMLLPHELQAGEKKYRYRVVNACLGKKISCSLNHSAPQYMNSGELISYKEQPTSAHFKIVENERSVTIKLEQDAPYSNATFVIYEQKGELRYLALGEESKETFESPEHSDIPKLD